jgi:hypothetical protein
VQGRFTLKLSDSLDITGLAKPGFSGGNHLPSPHCETITLSFAKPDGMGITPAISPGQSNWPGLFS